MTKRQNDKEETKLDEKDKDKEREEKELHREQKEIETSSDIEEGVQSATRTKLLALSNLAPPRKSRVLYSPLPHPVPPSPPTVPLLPPTRPSLFFHRTTAGPPKVHRTHTISSNRICIGTDDPYSRSSSTQRYRHRFLFSLLSPELLSLLVQTINRSFFRARTPSSPSLSPSFAVSGTENEERGRAQEQQRERQRERTPSSKREREGGQSYARCKSVTRFRPGKTIVVGSIPQCVRGQCSDTDRRQHASSIRSSSILIRSSYGYSWLEHQQATSVRSRTTLAEDHVPRGHVYAVRPVRRLYYSVQ